jgi:hypothetical protein
MEVGNGNNEIDKKADAPQRRRPTHKTKAKDKENPTNIIRVARVTVKHSGHKTALMRERIKGKYRDCQPQNIKCEADEKRSVEYDGSKEADDKSANQPNHGSDDDALVIAKELGVLYRLAALRICPLPEWEGDSVGKQVKNPKICDSHGNLTPPNGAAEARCQASSPAVLLAGLYSFISGLLSLTYERSHWSKDGDTS